MSTAESKTKVVTVWGKFERDVSSALNNITNLKAVKAKIIEAKNTINADPDFDSGDIARAQELIDEVISAIATI